MATTDDTPDAFGGVVFDGGQRVLLRKPHGEFDGYVWTFPKGRPLPGEEPAAAAARLCRDRTGHAARVLGPVPGVYRGGTSRTAYFLMQAAGDARPGRPEQTDAVVWADRTEVADRLRETRNPVGRERDLVVWRAVEELLRRAMTRLSWQHHPMPDRRERLPLRLDLTWDEMARVAAGHRPQEMEDRWFVLFEHPWLYLHRSWTGLCVYQLRFGEFGGRWSVAEAWVNRDPRQYTGTDTAWDMKLVRFLLHMYFRAGPDPGPL
jgi:ADP-ribose pyrophosphatase YjhB (NUDIX family)